MHLSSQLTYERWAAWVGLFEQGFGYRGSARQVGVGLESARSLYRRCRIRDTVGLVRKLEASWVCSYLFWVLTQSVLFEV